MVLATIDGAVMYRSIDRADIAVPEVADDATTWLLIGSDDRSAAKAMPSPDAFGTTNDVPGARADVMLLVRSAHDGHPARVVSIPRDLLVYRFGHGADRLALTFLDSPASTVKSICGSLGVAIDHVVIVEFDDVRRIVDEVGGVEVTVARPTRDLHTGLDLPAGTSTLDGAGAIAWVRARHLERWSANRWVPDVRGDQARQDSQRALLASLAAKIGKQARNPWNARRLARSIAHAVTIDDRADLIDLGRLARALDEQPKSEALPHTYLPGKIPVAKLIPDAQFLLDELRTGTPEGSSCPRARPQPA